MLQQSDRATTCRTRAFPFGRVKRITIAGAPVLALRVTYVGELGWELHIPVEFAADRLRRADGGRRAARHRQCRLSRHRVAAPGEGLPRLGRRYRARPLAAGRGPRLGGEAEIEHAVPGTRPRSKRRPQSRCRACSPASPPIPRSCSWGARPSIATASASAGSPAAATATRSAARSATATSAIRRTASTRDVLLSGRYELEVATTRVPAEIFLDPLYDPTMSRIKELRPGERRWCPGAEYVSILTKSMT